MKRQLNLKKKNHFKKMNVVAIFFFWFVCLFLLLFVSEISSQRKIQERNGDKDNRLNQLRCNMISPPFCLFCCGIDAGFLAGCVANCSNYSRKHSC